MIVEIEHRQNIPLTETGKQVIVHPSLWGRFEEFKSKIATGGSTNPSRRHAEGLLRQMGIAPYLFIDDDSKLLP